MVVELQRVRQRMGTDQEDDLSKGGKAAMIWTNDAVQLLLRELEPVGLMKAELLSKYMKKLPKNYELPNVMLTAFFVYYGERTAFRRITFRPRKAGKNSMDMRKIARTGLRAVRDFLIIRKSM